MRLRKAWLVTVEDGENKQVFYADTAKDAAINARRSGDFSLRHTKFIARRAKEYDVLLPERHKIVDTLDEKEIYYLIEALCIGNDPPDYTTGGIGYYYGDKTDQHLLSLCEKGLMEEAKEGDFWCHEGKNYFLHTSLGETVALSIMPLYRSV